MYYPVRTSILVVALVAMALIFSFAVNESVKAESVHHQSVQIQNVSSHGIVECQNYVFVDRHPDGTWTCPPASEQLPKEKIRSSVNFWSLLFDVLRTQVALQA